MRIFSYAIPVLLLCALTGCQSTSPATSLPLQNSGFEGASINKKIPGWSTEEHAGQLNGRAYEMIIDSTAGPGGGTALRVTQLHKEIYGLVHQKVPVGAVAAGKTFNFSALVKSDNVGPKGWALVVNLNSTNGILEQVQSLPIVGTTGWHKLEATGPIPKGTAFLDVGFLHRDSGTGWATEPSLSIN